MRGYVREEVNSFLAGLAAQVAERDARIAALEAQLAQASQPAQAVATPALDRAELLRHLGEEAASILTCADATAERMKAQAGVAAQRVQSDLAHIGTGLNDVHQLLGELVSLVQGLTEESGLLALVHNEVSIADTPAPTVSVAEPPPVGSEVRTVLGEVLGLDVEDEELHLPAEGLSGSASTS